MDFINSKLYKTKQSKPRKKSPKNIVKILFTNKALDFIDISKIIRHTDVKNLLPDSVDNNDSPMVVYNLTKPIRSKLFNHKRFVQELDVEDFLNNPENYPCKCNTSPFKDENHKHIISGDINIVHNNKLRRLISKGPNYREPVLIDFKIAKESIINGLNECISNWSSKSNISPTCFLPWKSNIIERLEDKIKNLKTRIKPRQVKQCFNDPKVVSDLESLHKDFVICPIDKAANNVAFVCKRFYITVLLTEMGIFGQGSETYDKIDKTPTEIIEKLKRDLKNNFSMEIDKDNVCLPVAYWLPKMHKNPIGYRFIIASKTCTNKELSKYVTSVFKLFHMALESYWDISKFHSGVNSFWIIQNNEPVVDAINRTNKKSSAKSISTFDFSTLYTKIPHNKLLDSLVEIIDFAFKGNSRGKISISSNGNANWVNNARKSSFVFDKSSLIEAVKFLITNCYFTVGNMLLKQIIGIPMGLDPAPYFANDFLFSYESKWIKKTKNLTIYWQESLVRLIGL